MDHDVDRRWQLRRVLEAHPEEYVVVGEAENSEKALWWAEWTRPDLVILDEDMPETDGLETLPALRRILPEAHIVLHAERLDEEMVHAARVLEANACIEKGLTRDQFHRCLRLVLSRPVSDELGERMRVFR